MPQVYDDKPEVIKVKLEINGYEVPAMFVVGSSETDIQNALAKALHGLAAPSEPTKKHRKPRRTKAEMAQAATSEVPPPHRKEEAAVWP